MPRAETPGNTTAAPRRIPEAYLRAEIAAYPLAGEAAFGSGLRVLDPGLAANSPTAQLWRACEAQFAQHTGWSLDRLVSARDRGWFGAAASRAGDATKVPMHRYLRTLASSHLVSRAGMTEIEDSSDLSALDAAAHYRWLMLTMPEDLLLCALDVDPPPSSVDLDPPLLIRHLLDSGVAEIHQHVGAGMDFPLLWASALAAIASPDLADDALHSPGAPLGDGRQLLRWLLAAAVARCALAEHLIRGGPDLQRFLQREYLGADPATQRHPAWTPRRRETLVDTLAALTRGDASRLPALAPLRDLYADIHPGALRLGDWPLTSVQDAFERCDPIAVRLGLRGRNVGERWLLQHAMAHMFAGEADPQGRGDPAFARLFWQAARVRCQVYRALVQRPLTGGLQWFTRFYRRIGKLRAPLQPILPEVCYSVDGLSAGSGHGIKALELRTSADDSAMVIAEGLLGMLQSWQRVLAGSAGPTFEPEFGVLFHFVKSRDAASAWAGGLPPAFWSSTHAQPDKGALDVQHGRYASYFAEQCVKARALAELIQAVPSSLWLVRGLDVADDELAVPTWVLAPLFRHVTDAAARASVRPGAGPPLRLTAHVGEDFRHLMEGLRHIDEQLHYVMGYSAGRLGHAVALGVEPQGWAESVGTILMPAEERLWDLVWEWRLYSRYKIKPEFAAEAPPGRVEVVLNQLRAVSDLVHGGQGYPVEQLAEAHHLLHRFMLPPFTARPQVDGGFDSFQAAARRIRDWRQPGRQVHAPVAVSKILLGHLSDGAVFRRGQTLIDLPIHAGEVAALNAVQRALRRGIAQSGIVVEVNPSSNLLIGDLLDLRHHPILRLFPPQREAGDAPPVMIALGSDDPLTFGTQLLREYSLLHQAAVAAGYPERVVQDWLDAIRRTGMDARFTRAWKPGAQAMADRLVCDLSRFLSLPRADRPRPPCLPAFSPNPGDPRCPTSAKPC